YQYSGTPMDGYVVEEPLTADISTVLIAGKTSVLESVSAIEVPATAVNITDQDQSYTESVDLGRYLPDGVRFADASFDGMAAVRVELIKLVVRSLNIPVQNLSVVNLPNGFDAEIMLNESGEPAFVLHIITEGVASSYEGVSGNSVTGVLDIASYLNQNEGQTLSPGTYRIEITFSLPETIQTTTTYYADVKITKEEE
ncbi:MAG: hypothetical protein J6K26_13200, partial [Lachnospiraceae bacterium]|nr:hypothetical protein [Lachnospiraceae bacterium]